MIQISGSTLIIKKNRSATLRSVYGIGRVRAKKISDLLLNNPKNPQFKRDLIKISQDPWVQKLFKSFEADNQLKMSIFSNLEAKATIKCYSGIRILQNLPSKGQRTHTNSGTPKRNNPFLKLGVNDVYALELIESNKKTELAWNNRSVDYSGNDKMKRRKFNKGVKDAKAKAKTVKKVKKK